MEHTLSAASDATFAPRRISTRRITMSETSQKMLGLCAIIVSIFLLIGGLYLPFDFIAEPLQGILTFAGVVLLIGGNVIMVVAHSGS